MTTDRKRGNPRSNATETARKSICGLRNANGWTLEDVSAELSRFGWPISVPSLSKLERGERRIDADDLAAFAGIYSVTIADLVSGVELVAPLTFTLTITLGNEAMSTRDDVAEALHKLAADIGTTWGDWAGELGSVRDVNGNTVGSWGVK